MSDVPRIEAYPVNSVIGGLGPKGVDGAVAELSQQGVDRDRVEIICGAEGLRRVDADGRHHGWRDRLRRWSQHFGAEGEHLHRAEELLRSGALLVRVEVEGEEEKQRVAQVLARNGGSDVHYLGRTSIEDLPV